MGGEGLGSVLYCAITQSGALGFSLAAWGFSESCVSSRDGIGGPS
jgi:hypothetical protein